MKSAFLFRNARVTLFRSLNPNPNLLSVPHPILKLSTIFTTSLPSSSSSLNSRIGRRTFRAFSATPSSSSMAEGETGAVPPPTLPSSSSDSVEKQFEKLHHHLQESVNLRERIRAAAADIESATRIMHAALLLVHQSRPIPDVLEKAEAQIGVLKELYGRIAEIISECPGQYYRYHADWKSETQAVVSQLAFMHWLETGSLVMHAEAEEKLGLNKSEFGLDIEDYLIGLCFMSNDLPRYVVNRVTAGDYDCPGKVLAFLTDLHAAFRMLNLRNDLLRKKFDGMKYDLRKVEEVHYDVKIRGLVAKGDSTGKQEMQG